MKKFLCLLLAVALISAFTACGSGSGEAEGWTREGYFTDENDLMASVTYMEDIDEPGWYVGLLTGEDWVEDSYGGTLSVEGNTLKGTLTSGGSKGDINVTVSEEGEDGLMVEVEGGETYHFKEYDMPDATIFVNINTEGLGNIAYTEGEETPEIDEEYPYQSAQINLAEPTTHTFLAWPREGNKFVKWTKDGEDFSTDAQITVLLDETAEYIAVFETDENYQDPVEPFKGEYRGKEGQCERASASVFANGDGTALINIQWGSSADSARVWVMSGKLDTETMTLTYNDCSVTDVTYNSNGETEDEVADHYDGTGTIVFNDDGTFIWNDDQDEYDDLTFEKAPDEEE